MVKFLEFGPEVEQVDHPLKGLHLAAAELEDFRQGSHSAPFYRLRSGPPSGKTTRDKPDGRGILLPGLWAARASSGLSQGDLAEIVGTTQNTVFALETLAREAYPKTARKLCRALEVEPQDLMCDNPNKTTKGSTMSKVTGGVKDGRFVLRATYDTKDAQDISEMMNVLRDPDADADVVAYDEDHVEIDLRPGW